METLYLPELSGSQTNYKIEGDELKHCKALRLNICDEFYVTNGTGLSANAIINEISKNHISVSTSTFTENKGELPFRLGLAIGILENKDRFEFALEKAVELGITDFYPLLTEFTQRKNINTERMKLKAIAAMKQCKRSILTAIHPIVKLKDISIIAKEFDKIVLADENGELPQKSNNISTLVLIGPEGGFSETELQMLKLIPNILSLNLGNRRLRSETAALTALASVIL
jgi:16S rRNA (uracil1498-N3)-methyltransferase